MRDMKAVLNPALSGRHRTLIAKYTLPPRSIAWDEWPMLLEAFDLLGTSLVILGEERYTWQTFYRVFINGRYADRFLEQLVQTADVESEGFHLVAQWWSRIEEDLRALGVDTLGVLEQQCFLSFCLYWWSSFGKGYIRELAIFQDMKASGIVFTAHDVTTERGRRSPYDLSVLGLRGDVKSSTYFLHVARSFPLQNDFYISRIYNPSTRCWVDIVLMSVSAWEKVNGGSVPTTLERMMVTFPTPARIHTRDKELVVIEYTRWKERIRTVQAQLGGER